MTDFVIEDFDLDDELALLEKQGASSDKYFIQSNMHSMAAQKYTAAAKGSANPAHAKTLRAIGKKHKVAAEALAGIAGLHVDHLFKSQQAAKKAMPAGLQEETDMADEDIIEEATEFDPVRALISLAIDKNALGFQEVLDETMQALARSAVEQVQEAMFDDDKKPKDEDEDDEDEDKDDDNQSAKAGADDDKLSEEAEELEEISVTIPGQKTAGSDKGKNVGDGDQGPRTIKKVAFSKKKPEQKSVSKAAGDTFRSQEAAD